MLMKNKPIIDFHSYYTYTVYNGLDKHKTVEMQ